MRPIWPLFVLAGLVILGWWGWRSFGPKEPVWVRETPLTSPIRCVSVKDGELILEDGSRHVPAGVRPIKEITPEEWDTFLLTAASEGVEIIRRVDETHSFLMVEVRLWNWCGTCARQSGVRGRYKRAHLSEFAVIAGYASLDPDALDQLTELERWRVEGSAKVAEYSSFGEPSWYDPERRTFSYSLSYPHYWELDDAIEAMTETRPPQIGRAHV